MKIQYIKLIVILVIALFGNNLAYPQQIYQTWDYTYPQTSNPGDLVLRNDGTVFLTGTVYNGTQSSALTLGIDECKHVDFENIYSYTNTQKGAKITSDANNNIYVVSDYDLQSMYLEGVSNIRKFLFNNINPQWSLEFYPQQQSKLQITKKVLVDNAGSVYTLTEYFRQTNYLEASVIQKISSTGQYLWNHTYLPGRFTIPEDMAIDQEGNIVVVGGSGLSDNNYDIKVLKYHSNGTLLYDFTYPGNTSQSEGAKSVIIDNSNNIYITGCIMWDELGGGTDKGTTTGAKEYCLTMKLSPQLSMLWVRLFIPPDYFSAFGDKIKHINNNYLTVAGFAQSESGNLASRDYLVIRYDMSNGRIIWYRLYDYARGRDQARDIALDENGNSYVTGFVSNVASYPEYYWDVGTIKLDANGAIVGTWIYNDAYDNSDIGTNIVYAGNNTFYVLGVGYGGSSGNRIKLFRYGVGLPVYCDQQDHKVKKSGFKELLPTEYTLKQNYPNPFNPITRIEYAIPTEGHVVLNVYDIFGKELKTMVNEYKEAGNYTSDFDGSEFASGVYFYKLQVNGYALIKRMILVK